MKNWLVVANAARARVLEMSDKGEGYVHVADLVHPQSRQKAAELGGEKAGRGSGTVAPVPAAPTSECETPNAARWPMTEFRLATGRCAGLVLVASNPFLGELKEHLDTQARQRVLRTVPSDYTSLDERELAQRLAAT
jgi:hypothetical protein